MLACFVEEAVDYLGTSASLTSVQGLLLSF